MTILTAKDGYVYYNDETYGKIVYLGKNDRAENWVEITEEEAESPMTETEQKATAYDILMGVSE